MSRRYRLNWSPFSQYTLSFLAFFFLSIVMRNVFDWSILHSEIYIFWTDFLFISYFLLSNCVLFSISLFFLLHCWFLTLFTTSKNHYAIFLFEGTREWSTNNSIYIFYSSNFIYGVHKKNMYSRKDNSNLCIRSHICIHIMYMFFRFHLISTSFSFIFSSATLFLHYSVYLLKTFARMNSFRLPRNVYTSIREWICQGNIKEDLSEI